MSILSKFETIVADSTITREAQGNLLNKLVEAVDEAQETVLNETHEIAAGNTFARGLGKIAMTIRKYIQKMELESKAAPVTDHLGNMALIMVRVGETLSRVLQHTCCADPIFTA